MPVYECSYLFYLMFTVLLSSLRRELMNHSVFIQCCLWVFCSWDCLDLLCASPVQTCTTHSFHGTLKDVLFSYWIYHHPAFRHFQHHHQIFSLKKIGANKHINVFCKHENGVTLGCEDSQQILSPQAIWFTITCILVYTVYVHDRISINVFMVII